MALSFAGISQNTEEGVKWYTVNEAQKMQKENPKDGILIDFYTPWCGPCKMMEKSTFPDKDLAAYLNEHFYMVKFNAEGNEVVEFNGTEYSNPNYDPARGNGRNHMHQFTKANNIPGYPSLVLYDKDLKVKQKLVGYKTAPILLQTLKQVMSK